jgi:hypothetical protein
MLMRPKGASIDEIVTAFGWQPHTVRGASLRTGKFTGNFTKIGPFGKKPPVRT